MKKDKNNIIEEPRDGAEKPRKSGVFTHLVCVVAAVIIWLVIMNITADKTVAPDEGTAYGAVWVDAAI